LAVFNVNSVQKKGRVYLGPIRTCMQKRGEGVYLKSFLLKRHITPLDTGSIVFLFSVSSTRFFENMVA
jgi:hypothetical protein